MSANPQISRALSASQSLLCLECGKCTANCPLAQLNGGYSPRRMMGQALTDDHDALMADPAIWSCLACGVCETRCPVDVDFTGLLQRVRAEALPEQRSAPVCTHGGTLQSLMRLMATPELRQNRLDWVTDDLRVAESGDVALFVGCLPHFDAYFRNLGLDLLGVARAAVKILNRVGIEPVLLQDERCCGHDLLWMGDDDNFRSLAEHNLGALEASGASTVLTTCAECLRTLKLDYTRVGGRPPWTVRHLSELMAEKVADGELTFAPREGVVTYHDPCRLGRHSGVYEPPRQVLESIPDLQLVEMDRNRQRAACCGTSAWVNCDLNSKKMQGSRLASAKDTGADTLITSCPKCSIHFQCALQDSALAERAGVQIRDLSVLAAEAMQEV